jgi:hypothetical protein
MSTIRLTAAQAGSHSTLTQNFPADVSAVSCTAKALGPPRIHDFAFGAEDYVEAWNLGWEDSFETALRLRRREPAPGDIVAELVNPPPTVEVDPADVARGVASALSDNLRRLVGEQLRRITGRLD